MALKYGNYDVTVWDEWSQNDSRYHEGECSKKWESFQGTSAPVTGATITQLAKENGWTSKFSKDDSFIDCNDSFIPTEVDKGYRLVNTDRVLGQEIKEPKYWNPSQQIIDYLESLFNLGDIIGYVNDGYLHTNGDIGAVMGDPNSESGAWIRFNPSDGQGVKNTNVLEFKYALVESDNMSIAQQNEIIR